MKTNYAILILTIFFQQFIFSQQMPLDFSDSSDNFNGFGNSSFSFNTNPDDSADDVGQFFNDGSDPWQGFYIDLISPIDLSQNQQITLSFYQFDPNVHTIYLKLENGSDSDVEVVQSTSGSGWANNIMFDFANATYSGTSNSVNATGTYNRLTIFIDGGNFTNGTYLIDDINDGSTPTDPYELDVIYSDLVWSDEFESGSTVSPIDSENWFHQTQLPAGGSWFNGEEQHYTNRIENSFVQNDQLNIVARSEQYTDQGVTKNYTSARLNSKFAFTYGRVDVRAKLPEGAGTWPAIWTLGKNINEDGGYWDSEYGTVSWPQCGEIDIMEHGLGPVNQVSSALHNSCDGCFGNTMNYKSIVLNDVANNYYTYSVNWSPDQIIFMIDGVGFYKYNPSVKDDSTWPYYEDQYILLNIAMGGIAGPIAGDFDEGSMVIDYVRVYQNVGLSVDEHFSSKFSVYPNPASDFINIKSEENIDNVRLYNALGQLVIDKNSQTEMMDISQLNSGVYVMKIQSGNLTTTKKIMID